MLPFTKRKNTPHAISDMRRRELNEAAQRRINRIAAEQDAARSQANDQLRSYKSSPNSVSTADDPFTSPVGMLNPLNPFSPISPFNPLNSSPASAAPD